MNTTAPQPAVTIPYELAVKATQALQAAGDEQAASGLLARSANLWVLTSWDIDGRTTFLGRDQMALQQGEQPEWTFGSAADAHLFTDADRDTFNPRELGIADDEVAQEALEAAASSDGWALAPDAQAIVDMHDNTDPDVVDEYIALAARADKLLGV